MQDIVKVLNQSGITDARVNEKLSRYTTWKVGGPADLFVSPRNKDQLQRTIEILSDYQIPWKVLGRGSNLLIRDKGIRGAVIKLDQGFDTYHIHETRVEAGGAVSTILLAAAIAKQGLTGFEFAGGIPGNVGGAVYMNAGAHGSEVSRILSSAEILTTDGKWQVLSNEEMKFSYRTSVLQKELPGIVTNVTFNLAKGEKMEVMATLAKYKDYRRQTQPLQFPCAGSVFRNPPGDHAGRLIEDVGLKGYRLGGAQISTMHANFIVNCGDATAQDILDLINYVIKTVKDKVQVTLEPEVLVVGEQ